MKNAFINQDLTKPIHIFTTTHKITSLKKDCVIDLESSLMESQNCKVLGVGETKQGSYLLFKPLGGIRRKIVNGRKSGKHIILTPHTTRLI